MDIQAQLQGAFEFQRRGGAGGKPRRETINTRHILFIVSGAFERLRDQVARRLRQSSIGFAQGADAAVPDAAVLREVTTRDFIDYGFEPEFIGRLPVRVACEELSADDLYEILHRSEGSVIRQYERAFRAYGIEVTFSEGALRVDRRARRRGTHRRARTVDRQRAAAAREQVRVARLRGGTAGGGRGVRGRPGGRAENPPEQRRGPPRTASRRGRATLRRTLREDSWRRPSLRPLRGTRRRKRRPLSRNLQKLPLRITSLRTPDSEHLDEGTENAILAQWAEGAEEPDMSGVDLVEGGLVSEVSPSDILADLDKEPVNLGQPPESGVELDEMAVVQAADKSGVDLDKMDVVQEVDESSVNLDEMDVVQEADESGIDLGEAAVVTDDTPLSILAEEAVGGNGKSSSGRDLIAEEVESGVELKHPTLDDLEKELEAEAGQAAAGESDPHQAGTVESSVIDAQLVEDVVRGEEDAVGLGDSPSRRTQTSSVDLSGPRKKKNRRDDETADVELGAASGQLLSSGLDYSNEPGLEGPPTDKTLKAPDSDIVDFGSDDEIHLPDQDSLQAAASATALAGGADDVLTEVEAEPEEGREQPARRQRGAGVGGWLGGGFLGAGGDRGVCRPVVQWLAGRRHENRQRLLLNPKRNRPRLMRSWRSAQR